MDMEYGINIDGKMVWIPSMDQLCTILKEKFGRQEQRIEQLNNEIKELKDEHWKDKKLQDMKKRMDQMSKDYWRGFPISQEEKDAITKWETEHIKNKHNNNHYAGAIGGRFLYTFIPTSIGTIGTIKCSCGEEFTFQEMK